jgi:MFS family permease
MYGHKRVYMLGWIWFGVWSFITGFSYTSNNIFFSICRAFQGIGKSRLFPIESQV